MVGINGFLARYQPGKVEGFVSVVVIDDGGLGDAKIGEVIFSDAASAMANAREICEAALPNGTWVNDWRRP